MVTGPALSDDEAPIIAVGGVVYRRIDKRIELLLIKKQVGYWTLPKGHVHVGEALQDAAVREISEETGVSALVESDVREVAYTIFKRGKKRRKVVTYYLMRAVDGEPRPDPRERIKQVRWFPARAALRRIRRGRVRAVARRACDLLERTQESQQSEDV